MNNVITASRQAGFLKCQREHYWCFEIGLRPVASGRALTIGTAWHAAMEARWKSHATYDQALAAAMPRGIALDKYDCARIAAMLAAYWRHYSSDTQIRMCAEEKFKYPLAGADNWTCEGKIDRLGQDSRELLVLVEYKTTSDSVEPQSGYWLRLRFNNQVFQYVHAAREQFGWDLHEVIYDVVRKPGLQPKQVTDKDAKGRKIVVDSAGKRVWKDKRKGIAQESASATKGWTVQTHTETPDEFLDRLIADIESRTAFYFARREVPILEDDLNAFIAQRLVLARQIQFNRQLAKVTPKPEQAWPRNITEDNCRFCPYASFCLQNISPDLNNPPAGLQLRGFNPELKDETTNTTQENSNADNPAAQ